MHVTEVAHLWRSHQQGTRGSIAAHAARGRPLGSAQRASHKVGERLCSSFALVTKPVGRIRQKAGPMGRPLAPRVHACGTPACRGQRPERLRWPRSRALSLLHRAFIGPSSFTRSRVHTFGRQRDNSSASSAHHASMDLVERPSSVGAICLAPGRPLNVCSTALWHYPRLSNPCSSCIEARSVT